MGLELVSPKGQEIRVGVLPVVCSRIRKKGERELKNLQCEINNDRERKKGRE